MLNRKEFAHYFLMKVQEYASPEYTVQEEKVHKTNQVKTGILVCRESIALAIYPDDHYQKYLDGADKELLTKHVFQSVIYSMRKEQGIREFAHSIENYEYAKDKIFPQVMNYGKNKTYLKMMPHERFLDLAVIVYVSMEQYEVKITPGLLTAWGKTKEEVFEQAQINDQDKNPSELLDMGQVISENLERTMDMEDPFGQPIVSEEIEESSGKIGIITNKSKKYGAAAILDTRLLQQISGELGEYYILPSSIHEMIILPEDSREFSIEDLEAMVKEVNSTFVDPAEVLSDHVYKYTDEKIKVYENGKEIDPQKEQEDIKKVNEIHSPKL